MSNKKNYKNKSGGEKNSNGGRVNGNNANAKNGVNAKNGGGKIAAAKNRPVRVGPSGMAEVEAWVEFIRYRRIDRRLADAACGACLDRERAMVDAIRGRGVSSPFVALERAEAKCECHFHAHSMLALMPSRGGDPVEVDIILRDEGQVALAKNDFRKRDVVHMVGVPYGGDKVNGGARLVFFLARRESLALSEAACERDKASTAADLREPMAFGLFRVLENGSLVGDPGFGVSVEASALELGLIRYRAGREVYARGHFDPRRPFDGARPRIIRPRILEEGERRSRRSRRGRRKNAPRSGGAAKAG